VSALGPAIVAVTMGSEGAVLMIDGEAVAAPAPPVNVVDTLGAGDAFIARLLLGLVRGEAPEVVVGSATAYASQSCTTYGAFGYAAELPADLDLTSSNHTSPDKHAAATATSRLTEEIR